MLAGKVGDEDGELLAGLKLDLAPLAGERVGRVHPDDAADAVESLVVVGDVCGRFGDYIGSIAPGHFPAVASFVEGDVGIRLGQNSAVIYFLSSPRVDRERGGNDQKSAAHCLYFGEMTGDVLAGLVIDGIVIDRVVALARVRAAAAGAGLYGKNRRKTVDQNVRAAGQGLAVVILTGALRNQGDGAVPGPVAVRSVEPGKVCDVDVIRDVARFLDTIYNRRAARHLILDKALDIFFGEIGDFGLRDSLGVLAVFGHSRFFASFDGDSLLPVGIVRISDLGGTFQHAYLGDADNMALLGGETLEVYGLHLGSAFISDRHTGGIDNSAADTDGHGGCRDAHGLALAQLLTYVQEYFALCEVH